MWEENASMPQRQRRASKAAAMRTEQQALDSHVRSGHDDEAQDAEQLSPALRSSAEPGCSYEYLDHTADIQIHAWGPNLETAFANTGLAMFNYMTPLSALECKDEYTRVVATSRHHDMHTLLYGFLDELLFIFLTDFLVFKELTVIRLDQKNWSIEARGRGEIFDRTRHACGTEIKAITYSAMQVIEESNNQDSEVFVIVDI